LFFPNDNLRLAYFLLSWAVHQAIKKKGDKVHE
jgi:hypothetical protein